MNISKLANCCFRILESNNCQHANISQLGDFVKKLKTMSVRQVLDMTQCKTPCNYYHYEGERHFSVYVQVVVAKHNILQGIRFFNSTESVSGQRRERILHIVLSSVQQEIPIEEQILVYDRSNLIADVGGYLGLLLGVSILSCYKEFIRFITEKRKLYMPFLRKQELDL